MVERINMQNDRFCCQNSLKHLEPKEFLKEVIFATNTSFIQKVVKIDLTLNCQFGIYSHWINLILVISYTVKLNDNLVECVR